MSVYEEAKKLISDQDDAREMLEALIDASTLQLVIEDLAAICEDKAIHISEAYSDKRTANRWGRAARALEGVAGYKAVKQL